MKVATISPIDIIAHFGIKGKCLEQKVIDSGHINNTYLLECENQDGITEKFTLQLINVEVFRKPDELMQNIIAVTSFLKDKIMVSGGNPRRETLDFLLANTGKYYHCDHEGNYWRCYRYVDDVYTCNMITDSEVFQNAGAAFGSFQNLLHDFPIDSLYDTIPDFHNTVKRFSNLENAIAKNLSGRVADVNAEIEFALARKDYTPVIVNSLEDGSLPFRVTHNDTKLNNILFDLTTGKAICIIDLDTVMKGSALYDFGDSIRYGANTAAEDEKDISKVSLDLKLYESYVKGFLSTAGTALTKKEIELLPFSAMLMTYECGMRFLTDYIDGDIYFKTAYPEHNLDRCRTQFALVKDIEDKFEKMLEITNNSASQISHERDD